MSSARNVAPSRGLEKFVKFAFIAVIVSTVLTVAYYVNDRYRQPNVSLADRTATQFEDVLVRDPQNLTARIGLAESYLAKKMYDQAIANYAAVLQSVPDHQVALLGLGIAYMRKGDNGKMAEYFNRIVELNKDQDWARVDPRLEAAYYHLGRVALERKDYSVAVDRLKQAVEIDRTDSDALYLLGNALLANGDVDRAIISYRLAVSFVPDFLEAYEGMRQALDQAGQPQRKAYPEAMITYVRGDKGAALRQLEGASQTVVDDPDLFAALGMMRQEAGNRDEATAAYRKAVELNPNHALAKAALRAIDSGKTW